jgi:hypothetical protein
VELKIQFEDWVLVAHICNHSYSAGKDQDRRIAVQSQPRQISFTRPYLKKPHHKKGLVEWLKG